MPERIRAPEYNSGALIFCLRLLVKQRMKIDRSVPLKPAHLQLRGHKAHIRLDPFSVEITAACDVQSVPFRQSQIIGRLLLGVFGVMALQAVQTGRLQPCQQGLQLFV